MRQIDIEGKRLNDAWKHKCLTLGCSFDLFDRHQAVALRFAQGQLAYTNGQVVNAAAETLYQWFAKGRTDLPQTEQEVTEWTKDLLISLSGNLLLAMSRLQASCPGWFNEAKEVWAAAKSK